jgi:hypothetical protein
MARREERAAPRRLRLLDGGAVSVIAGRGEAGGSAADAPGAAPPPAPGVRGVAGPTSGDIGGEGVGVV